MLSSVLHSQRAIEVNIAIMRAFVRLREILSTNKELLAKLEKIERKVGEHDEHFHVVFEAIRQLMAPPPATGKKRRIGFPSAAFGRNQIDKIEKKAFARLPILCASVVQSVLDRKTEEPQRHRDEYSQISAQSGIATNKTDHGFR